jgi:hypothetical protein
MWRKRQILEKEKESYKMEKDNYFIIGVVVIILAFLATLGYAENAKLECRQYAIQQGLSASDVQAICK